MNTFRFRDFPVYQEAKRFSVELFRLTKDWDRDLRSQLIRSSLSIRLNIAEGSAKKSDKDFHRYLQTSLGSVNETVAGLEVAMELGLISSEIWHKLLVQAESIANQLGGFSKALVNGQLSTVKGSVLRTVADG